MDDTDPQKFFMSGERTWVMTKGMGRSPGCLDSASPPPPGFTGYVPRARFLFGSSFPVLTNQALQEFGQKCSKGRVQKDPKPLSPLPRPNFQNLGLLPHYGGYVPGERLWELGCVCGGGGGGWGGVGVGVVWGTGISR